MIGGGNEPLPWALPPPQSLATICDCSSISGAIHAFVIVRPPSWSGLECRADSEFLSAKSKGRVGTPRGRGRRCLATMQRRKRDEGPVGIPPALRVEHKNRYYATG